MMLNDMIRTMLDIRDELAPGDDIGGGLAQALADHLWLRSRGETTPATAASEPTALAPQPAAQPPAPAPAPAQQPPAMGAGPDNPFAGM